LLAACFYILTTSFIITYRYKLFKSHTPAAGLFPDKYITQRVLRI
jgi:hypothetical protein